MNVTYFLIIENENKYFFPSWKRLSSTYFLVNSNQHLHAQGVFPKSNVFPSNSSSCTECFSQYQIHFFLMNVLVCHGQSFANTMQLFSHKTTRRFLTFKIICINMRSITAISFQNTYLLVHVFVRVTCMLTLSCFHVTIHV